MSRSYRKRGHYRKRDQRLRENALGLLLIPGFLWFGKYRLHLTLTFPVLIEVTVFIVGLVSAAFLLGPGSVHKRLKPNQMDQMSGEDFERLLQQTLKKTGWKLRTTSKTGDFGGDLIGHSPWGVSYAIQAKRWKDKVGVSAVQQAYAAQAHYHTDRALVITNSWLTKPARQHAGVLGVEVWERPRLEREFAKAFSTRHATRHIDSEKQSHQEQST
ncbi:restriction endonuclease [Alicyclobacillus mengziensis]|uniref:Restriction endonuclease n=1 Tax=Alicyclobacillus mengziensis TaxID=2931921 RepID=A0A9X7W3J2_9BACL|nr:restriction endonuclease [Alicyclobacillus mengziensis]QSO50098.1 restriction endonuclease [Alicyclobacillus mengziensis]